ncbi:ComF family protein [Hirschia litorea]|uniref:ComF family protein n=1 Tax=Hirschia litorea TaxID=1199156 RepID=A0ABW2IK66_9PROT
MKMSWRKYAFFQALGNRLRRLILWIDELIWPKRSIVTGKQLAGPGLIEPEFWTKIRFLDCPVCACCGAPVEALQDVRDAYAMEECAACIARAPTFDRARAVFAYDEVTSQLVLRFKNGGDRSVLGQVADWVCQIANDLIIDADYIMAVPLHPTRLRKRGYNQSLWLAAAIARKTGKTLSHHMLKRKKNTLSQAGRSASGRRRNVEGAFHIPKRHLKRLEGKRVVLIDDVFTTGATVEACAKCLKRSGVAHVDVVTLARVVSPVDPTI